MKVFFSTDWTLNGSILTEDDNIITLHPQEVVFTPTSNNVCLIAENELGEIIATSGCGEEEPLITEGFIRFWASEGFPAEMDIDISLLYLEDYFEKLNSGEFDSEMEETFEEWLVGNGLEITLPKSDLEELEDQWNSMNHLYGIVCEESEDEDDEPNAPTYQQYQACENQLYRMVDKLKNQLSEIPSEIITFTDMYGNTYNTLKECEEGELRHKLLLEEQEEVRMAEYYKENPRGGNGEKKHKLVKRKDLQPKVDFNLLPNASGIIWSALTLLRDGAIDINHEIYQHAVKTANNLDLFMQCMKNPKFATKASHEIEKILNK